MLFTVSVSPLKVFISKGKTKEELAAEKLEKDDADARKAAQEGGAAEDKKIADAEKNANRSEIIEDLITTNWTKASPCYDTCISYDRITNVTLADYNALMEVVWGDVSSLSFHWMKCTPEPVVNQMLQEY